MKTIKNPYTNYGAIPTFQKGGVVEISEEKRKELFPYFAYLYSQQLNPEKYGATESVEEWIELIQQSEEDIAAITTAAEELTSEDWKALETQYEAAKEEDPFMDMQKAQYAAKGAKLKKLREVATSVKVAYYKKGGTSKKKINKKKKCKCGCDLVLSRGAGGKIVQKCSCGCKGVK